MADVTPRPTYRKAWLVCAVAVLALALWYGYVILMAKRHVQLAVNDDTMRATRADHTFAQTLQIANIQGPAERITGLTSTQRGVVMTGTDAVGRRIGPTGSSVVFRVRYHVVDCAAAKRGGGGPVPVRLQLRGRWGNLAVTVVDEGSDFTGDAIDACGGWPS